MDKSIFDLLVRCRVLAFILMSFATWSIYDKYTSAAAGTTFATLAWFGFIAMVVILIFFVIVDTVHGIHDHLKR